MNYLAIQNVGKHTASVFKQKVFKFDRFLFGFEFQITFIECQAAACCAFAYMA